MPQRGIAYQPRVKPWEHDVKSVRSEGTPHKPHANRRSRNMRRSFRTRDMRSLVPRVSPWAGMQCPVGAPRTPFSWPIRSWFHVVTGHRLHPVSLLAPCPNGASPASGVAVGSILGRGIACEILVSGSIPRWGTQNPILMTDSIVVPCLTRHRLHPVSLSAPYPNGASPASGVVVGPMPQRGIAYQPRVKPWEHVVKSVRSEGTPHKPHANRRSQNMRRSFRTRDIGSFSPQDGNPSSSR